MVYIPLQELEVALCAQILLSEKPFPIILVPHLFRLLVLIRHEHLSHQRRGKV
jgi:hypothetical protein